MNEEKPKTLGKKVLTVIITVIVTLFVLFMIIFAWVLIKNPLNVRGIILFKLGWTDKPVQIMPVNDQETPNVEPSNNSETSPSTQTTPTTPSTPTTALPMTDSQREAVESFGIDPDSVIITPDMENCFIEKLGSERVEEIKGGATPGVLEMMKASSCL